MMVKNAYGNMEVLAGPQGLMQSGKSYENIEISATDYRITEVTVDSSIKLGD